MSQLGKITLQSGVGRASPPYARGPRTPAVAQATARASAQVVAPPDDPAPDLPFTRHDLLELNAGVGRSSQVANALSTAHDALDVIDGLLGNVGAVLTAAASPADATFDRQTDQSRIDSAVFSIDAVAASARFAGRPLLDGTYHATGPAGELRLPSFASTQLGKDHPGASPISSLAAPGPNDLSAPANLAPATHILATAAAQVSGARAAITRFIAASSPAAPDAPAVPTGVAPADLLAAAAHDLLADPTLAAVAVANSAPDNVFALLRP